VKLCTKYNINEYVDEAKCPINKVESRPDGSFTIEDAYLSARGRERTVFNVVDIARDAAVLEIKEAGALVRNGYTYQIALMQDNGAFSLSGISCALPEDIDLKLILAGIILPDDGNCNVSGLTKAQTVLLFKTLMTAKWYVGSDRTYAMRKFTYQSTRLGETEYQSRYAQGLADQQKFLTERKLQDLANAKKNEIDWDGVAKRYTDELEHQRKLNCLGRGGGVFCN